MARTLAACAFLFAIALPAAADKILLKGGGSHEGRFVRETDSDITLAILVGGKPVEMTVAKNLIESYEKTASLLEQYEEKAAKVDRKNADALVELAGWCLAQQMPTAAIKHLREALALKPDHAKAASMIKPMGYIRDGSTWVSEADLKRSQGLDLWDGQWIPKDQAARLRAEREAKQAAAAAESKRQRDLETATRGVDRVDREMKAIREKIAQTTSEIDSVEARLKTLDTSAAEAEKRRTEAERRRDQAQNEMRNVNRDPRYNQNNDATRRYSEAKKDVKAAEQEVAVIVAEAERLVKTGKALQDEKQALEKQLAAKEAEGAKLANQKAVLEPAKDAGKEPPKAPPKTAK
jgi:myosin heavy subunit